MSNIFTKLIVIVAISRLLNCTNIKECGDQTSCDINCTYINSTLPNFNGCAGLTKIDARNAGSLTIDCSSPDSLRGGCQLIDILCPINGDCIINCNDYYGCGGTNIISSSISNNNNNSLILNCNYPHSSCFDTNIIIKNTIKSLDINCIGYNNNNNNYHSGSLSSTTCHNMNIHISSITDNINFYCNADYACSFNKLYANNSQTSFINISSIGLYSFYQNEIYVQSASKFKLFCGSQSYTIYDNNELGGCINSTFYLPSNDIKIECQGEGCYGPLDIYTINGGYDLNISLNTCSQCNHDTCINKWNIHCPNEPTPAVFSGSSCIGNESSCNCDIAKNVFLSNIIDDDDDTACHHIFTSEPIICPPDRDCIINCDMLIDGGCKNQLINAENSTNLFVTCTGKDDCDNSQISCPNTEGSQCNIICNGTNSCFETVISSNINTQKVNISCANKDACSYLVLNANNAYQIDIECTNSDACDYFNIFANDSSIINLQCKPYDIYNKNNNIYSSSYAACNNFNLFATNNKNSITIECISSFSCYLPNIYAQNANSLNINANGQYALYQGEIHAENIQSMFNLDCRSGFGEQGCYKTNLYSPQYDKDSNNNILPKFVITCEGHGCFQLNLYAINGYSDIDISIDGCVQCESVDDCVQDWNMYCGTNNYENSVTFDGLQCHSSHCQCLSMLISVNDTFQNQNIEQCGLFAPDITCNDDDTQCVIDCTLQKDGCAGKIIYGGNARSLIVTCDTTNGTQNSGCYETKIYCPVDGSNSKCDIKCVESESCYHTQIIGDEYNLIDIDCLSRDSCNNVIVTAPDANEINLLCFESGSCHTIDIIAKFVNTINMICDNNNDSDHGDNWYRWFWYYYYDDDEEDDNTVCNYVNIIGTNMSNIFNLECNGDYACNNLYIDVMSARIININGIGTRSIYQGEIHGENSESVNIILYAQDHEWCSWYNDDDELCSPKLYLPSFDVDNMNLSRVTIECQGYGCYDLNLYSPNGLLDYEFKLNGCGYCTQQWSCYDTWNIYCGSSDIYENELNVWSGYYCYSWNNICGCSDSQESLLSDSWDTYNSETCSGINDDVFYNYTCLYDDINYPGYCIINCSNEYYTNTNNINECRNKIINATNIISSIIVNCGLCENTEIYCPNKENTQCIINCVEDNSCIYTEIYSYILYNTLLVNCNNYGSCYYTNIIAPQLKQIDIYCDYDESCFGLQVEGTNVDTLNIVCKPTQETTTIDINYNFTSYYDYYYYYFYYFSWYYQNTFACYSLDIDANNTNTLNILCNGDMSCYSSSFNALYANTINLTAIGQESFYFNDLSATYVENSINVKCWSVSHDDDRFYYWSRYSNRGACEYSYFYIPSISDNNDIIKTNFICQGYGCYNLDIRSENGLNDINVLVDGCKTCSSTEKCIGRWDIRCQYTMFNGYSGYDWDTFTGSVCVYDHCDCNTDKILYQDSATCAYIDNNMTYPTIEPTSNDLISNTTNDLIFNTTNDESNNINQDSSSSQGTFISLEIFIIVIVIIFVIFSCILFFYYTRMNKKKKDIVQDFGGINNNTHDSIQMQLQTNTNNTMMAIPDNDYDDDEQDDPNQNDDIGLINN